MTSTVTVPIDPTEEMINAGAEQFLFGLAEYHDAGAPTSRPLARMYKAMVLAAPRPSPAGQPTDGKLRLAKRPVAFRVTDHADGWIYFEDEEKADAEAEATGALIQGLFIRDGTPLNHKTSPLVPEGLEERAREIIDTVDWTASNFFEVSRPGHIKYPVRTKLREAIASALAEAEARGIERAAKVADEGAEIEAGSEGNGKWSTAVAAAIRTLEEKGNG